MPKFDLKRDEYVLMQSEDVAHGGFVPTYTDDLVLTNQNIILVSKGMLGNTKKVHYFPLSSVKNIDHRPQVIASGLKLEIYFLDRHEAFTFRTKREVKVWVNNVSDLLNGGAGTLGSDLDKGIPGAAYVAETLKDTLDTFKNTFGKKSKRQIDQRVARECTSCVASISGLATRVVRCQFCNSDQQL